MKRKRPPMQPIGWDGKGVIRFQANRLVQYLLNAGGLDMNHLNSLDQDVTSRDHF